MKKESKKSWIKYVCASLALAIGMSVIAPSIGAYAAEKESTEIENYNNNLEVTDVYNDAQVDQIIKEIQQETNVDLTKTDNNQIQPRKVVSLLTKLAKKLGKKYVTQKLPKKIYSKLPKFVKRKVSQSAFVGGWNTYILMGPADSVKDSVTSWLKKHGVWGWAANSAGYIAQGVVWAILP